MNSFPVSLFPQHRDLFRWRLLHQTAIPHRMIALFNHPAAASASTAREVNECASWFMMPERGIVLVSMSPSMSMGCLRLLCFSDVCNYAIHKRKYPILVAVTLLAFSRFRKLWSELQTDKPSKWCLQTYCFVYRPYQLIYFILRMPQSNCNQFKSLTASIRMC